VGIDDGAQGGEEKSLEGLHAGQQQTSEGLRVWWTGLRALGLDGAGIPETL